MTAVPGRIYSSESSPSAARVQLYGLFQQPAVVFGPAVVLIRTSAS
ncbi:hypothetical protein [Streptomyces prunicolor]